MKKESKMNTDNISKLTTAGNNAISSVSGIISALEKFFPYWGLEGKALEIYIDDIAKSDKPKELKAIEILSAKQSFRKMKNMTSVLNFAAENLSEESLKKAIYSENEEWYDRFFENASLISEESAQRIWGKILANEIKSNGSTPRGLFRILSEIDSELAKKFTVLCSQRIMYVGVREDDTIINNCFINEVVILEDHDFYNSIGLDLATMTELEAIGLISSSAFGYKKTLFEGNKVLISDGSFTECMILKDDKSFSTGSIVLTEAGTYLAKLTDIEIDTNRHDIIVNHYKKRGYSFDQNNKKRIVVDGDKTYVTETPL